MQVCPCVRLRLWRQYGRDWHRLRNASPATLARVASTMHNPTPSASPFDVLDRSSSSWPEQEESPANKPPAIIYSKHGLGSQDEPPNTASSNIDWRFYIFGKHSRTAALSPSQLFAGQIHFLKKTHSPETHKEVEQCLTRWKEAVAVTWNMLESGQLPCELAKEDGSFLARILEQEQVYASSDEAGLAAEDAEDGQGRVGRIRKLWGALSQQEREAKWPPLLISTFRSYPELIVDVFTATFATSAAPSYVIEDALSYILRSNESVHLAVKLGFDDIFGLLKLATATQGVPLHIRQNTIYTFLRAAKTPYDVSDLYKFLSKNGPRLHLNTLMQFAHRLAKSPEHKTQAVDLMRLMVSECELDINSVKGSALCTVILSSGWGRVIGNNSITRAADATSGAASLSTTAGDKEQSGPTPARLFEQLLSVGLEPNIITYTAIIRELCSKGEIASAQEVLQIMLNAQTGLDAYVYSILMNGAKTAGHYPLIRQVAEAAASNKILHPYVWNDFLQAIHLMALSEARSDPGYKRPRVIPAFPLMLETYKKTFAPAPLLEVLPLVSQLHSASRGLGVGMDSSVAMRRRWEFVEELGPTLGLLPQLSPEELIEPTGVTLSTMVLGYIQGLSNPYDVIEFYSHFQRLLKTGHPAAVMIVEETGSMLYDIVIMALCEYDGMLRVALDVVSDMLRDASLALDDPEPLPSHTKSDKQWDAAELRQPGSQGKEKPPSEAAPAPDAGTSADTATPTAPGLHSPPSVYTWSILLNGFMFHRHTMQGERILRMMTKRGIQPNTVTWNTLIAGYARLQFARKTGNALLRREMAGYEQNEFTFRAFSYLGDKAAVIRYLERHRAANTAAADANVASAPPSSTTHRNRHPAIARELRSLQQDLDGIARTMDAEDNPEKQQQT